MKTFHAFICSNPDVPFVIFEETQDYVSRQTLLCPKSVDLAVIDAVDTSVCRSYPQPAVAVLKKSYNTSRSSIESGRSEWLPKAPYVELLKTSALPCRLESDPE